MASLAARVCATAIHFNSNGRLLALPANIRRGWEWMAVTVTIIYFVTSAISACRQNDNADDVCRIDVCRQNDTMPKFLKQYQRPIMFKSIKNIS